MKPAFHAKNVEIIPTALIRNTPPQNIKITFLTFLFPFTVESILSENIAQTIGRMIRIQEIFIFLLLLKILI